MKTTVRGTDDGEMRHFILGTPVCVIYDEDLNISVDAISPTYFNGKYHNISISFSLILTIMHSSRMHTARSLNVSHSICWQCACHTCPPSHHTCPPPHMPLVTHAPLACMLPCHACHPVKHAPLPCTSLAMHAPCHAAWPPCHAWPPCGQTDTCKNITFANFVCGW